jgi:hypothetical protein
VTTFYQKRNCSFGQFELQKLFLSQCRPNLKTFNPFFGRSFEWNVFSVERSNKKTEQRLYFVPRSVKRDEVRKYYERKFHVHGQKKVFEEKAQNLFLVCWPIK